MKLTPLKIALFFIITFSVLVTTCGFLIYKNVLLGLGAWNTSNNMSVFIKSDADKAQVGSLIEKIKSMSQVSSVQLLERADAAKDFEKSLKEYSSGLVTDDELLDLVPETLEIALTSGLSLAQRSQSFETIASRLKTENIIDEINFSAAWLKKFESVDRGLRAFGLLIFLALLLLISYSISLMLRVYIDDSKAEIEVYVLLGATQWSIYALYFRQLVVFLCTSLVCASALSYFVFTYVKKLLEYSGLSSNILQSLQFLNWSELLTLTVIFTSIVLLHSIVTIGTAVSRLSRISND